MEIKKQIIRTGRNVDYIIVDYDSKTISCCPIECLGDRVEGYKSFIIPSVVSDEYIHHMLRGIRHTAREASDAWWSNRPTQLQEAEDILKWAMHYLLERYYTGARV